MACPSCSSQNVRRTQPGILNDEYVCKSCGHEYTAVNGRNVLQVARIGASLFLGAGLFDVGSDLFDSGDS